MQSSKKISVLIKLLVVGLTFWFLYQKVFANESYLEIKEQFIYILNKDSYTDLIFVLLLMGLNWAIDALKWQFLIVKLEKVSFWLSLKAVFLGITVSMFTPNRIGEFGGRVFCLQNADRIKAVLVTIFGNLFQLIATVIFGLLALWYFTLHFSTTVFFGFFDNSVLVFGFCILLISSLLYVLFNISKLSIVLSKWKFLKKYEDYWSVFSKYSNSEILIVLLASISRYLVYSFQFYLLIRFVNIDVTFIESLTMSALTFLSMSVIPTIALTEIGVRGSVAIYFFGFLSENVIGIMTAAFTLWIINLVIPAIIGTLFVYQLKFFRK